VRTYDARLERFGLHDRDLSGSVPAGVAARFAVREGLIALALAPILLAGLLIFWLPYRVTDLIASRGSLDEQATTKVLAGIIVYGLWATLLGWLAWRAFGAGGALLALATLPVAAFAALFAVERETAVLRAVRGWLAVRRSSPGARAHLGRTRDEIVEVLDRVREWVAATEATGVAEIQRRNGVSGDERSVT
jgi:hypothetical protein